MELIACRIAACLGAPIQQASCRCTKGVWIPRVVAMLAWPANSRIHGVYLSKDRQGAAYLALEPQHLP